MILKKKIGILLPSLSDGGAEKVIVSLANKFHDYGFTVDLLLVQASGVYFDLLSKDVNVIDLNSKRAIFAIPRLISYIKRSEVDILFSALTHTNVTFVLSRYLSGKKVPIFISERSLISKGHYFSDSARHKKIKRVFFGFLYRRVTKIIAISDGCAEDIVSTIGVPRESIEVIYNPLLVEKVTSDSSEVVEVFSKKPKGDKVIIGVGRLMPVKNFSQLIRVFSEVSKVRSVSLIILGEGRQRKELEHQIEELDLSRKVSLPGFTCSPLKFMEKCDLFVSTSQWEGFGNVFLEAMSVSLPIVSVNCPGGPREILEDGKWGALVPPNDEVALANSIIKMLDSKEGLDASERLQSFELGLIARQYIKTFNLEIGGHE